MNFTPIDNRGNVEGYCLVKTVEKKVSSKGDTYLDFTLSDSTGEINAKLWRYSEEEYGVYAGGELVKVRGTVSQYGGADQLRIDRIRHTMDTDNVNVEDFVRTASYSSSDMYNELVGIANGFKDDDLKAIVTAIYSDNREALLYWPAAFKLHHAIRGGLLMHTLSIVRLCQSVCRIYPFLDEELLISGAMLHDIAKTEEFVVNDAGTVDGYSVKGNLLGHLTMGARTVEEYAKRLGIKEETAVLLEHMILSHHGVPEFGAAVKPMTAEAEILSELDLMDARVYEMREALSGAENGEFSGRVWALDNIKLFNHGRADLSKDPRLF